MNTAEAANIVGISPKQLRAYLRTHPQGGVGSGVRYEFTPEQAEELRERYWSQRQRAPRKQPTPESERVKALRLTAQREQGWRPSQIGDVDPDDVRRQARERIARLHELLSLQNLSVGAMPEKVLTRHGRALKRTIGDTD